MLNLIIAIFALISIQFIASSNSYTAFDLSYYRFTEKKLNKNNLKYIL